jgi:hypothetical protein
VNQGISLGDTGGNQKPMINEIMWVCRNKNPCKKEFTGAVKSLETSLVTALGFKPKTF